MLACPGHMHPAGRSFERSNRLPHGALGLGQCQGRSADRAGILPFPPAAVRDHGRSNLRMVPFCRAPRVSDAGAHWVRRAAQVPRRRVHRHFDDGSGHFINLAGWRLSRRGKVSSIRLRVIPILDRHPAALLCFPVEASRNSIFAAGFSRPVTRRWNVVAGIIATSLHLHLSIILQHQPLRVISLSFLSQSSRAHGRCARTASGG